uniref:Uncharacterized protein n=1 Tax=Arundo donax TaxID=35708 RepID=A0A0A9C0E1_ARUDO
MLHIARLKARARTMEVMTMRKRRILWSPTPPLVPLRRCCLASTTR